jgi:hypothetical protein
MAVDYISTIPWNDPFNPYPFYGQVTLSAADVSVCVLDLQVFDPNEITPIIYSNGSKSIWYNKDPYHGSSPAGFWLVDNTQLDLGLYQLNTSNLQLPVKLPGSAQGWQIAAEGPGEDPASLYIQPVYTSVAPWEQRRRWNLMG